MDITAEIQALNNELAAKLKAKNEAEEAYNAKASEANEWQRQSDVHAKSGYWDGLAYTDKMRDAAIIEANAIMPSVDRARAAYDDVQKRLSAAIANLTPAQQEAVNADIKLAQTNAENQATVAGVVKTALVQKTTKYLIYGAIALTLLVIGVLVFKKRFAA